MTKALDEGTWRNRFGAMLEDTRGSTYAIIAASVVPLLGFAGIGVDLGRAYMANSRLQSAVDAAVLAAVRVEQNNPGNGSAPGPVTVETVNAFLAANMPLNYMGAVQGDPAVTVERVDEEIRVNVTVNGTIPTSLMKVLNFETMPLSATATAVAGRRMTSAVEAMMVLDVTGSMAGNGGMVALKNSVRAFLDIVYGNTETRENFAIGMMPYNVVVNVGRLLPSDRVQQIDGFTDRSASSNWGWKGCVYADPTIANLQNDINVVDAGALDLGSNLPGDPGVPDANPFMYPPIQVRSFHNQDNRYRLGETIEDAIIAANHEPMRTALIRRYGTNICRTSDGANANCADDPSSFIHPNNLPNYNNWQTPAYYDSTRTVANGADVVVSTNSNSAVPRSPNYVCPTEALPVSYSRTKSQLQTYTDELQPLYNIGTWHNQAMAWGYRLIARDDVFKRSRPTDRSVRRVVIFMTDGNFDSNDQGVNVSVAGRNPAFQRDTAFSAYHSYADRLIVNADSSNLSTAREAHRVATSIRFAKTCQAMKAEGIEVYTITFAINSDATREMFKTCATDRNTHFYETQDENDLRMAFTTIASDLLDLHLEK